MHEVLKYLTDNPVFYIATVDGNMPKVRPFGFVMEYEGKLCFCTSNQKNVYKQLKANPNFELSTASADGSWLRLKGKAVFCTTIESKNAALKAAPMLKNMYSAEDSLFEIFYIEDGEATFNSMTGEPKIIKI